ncbi:MAG TPA: SprT family zinc-dependent metalloprotease [Allosphingosinicella sp.]|uniref:M48 family metallopeptidase n=1 Tax=Allosphingosinicella sp. TaxID=2823234 RepID=UPI002ED85C39
MSSELLFRSGNLVSPLIIKVSPRAKVMRLRVDPRTGAVLLTVPKRASRKAALKWVEGHRPWVEAALSKVPAPAAIEPGGIVPYLGLPHVIDWAENRSRLVRAEAGRLLVGGPLDSLEARIIRWLKQQARTVLDRETREFASLAEVTVARVDIGDPMSRWGSCSSSGTIRYSWRLILAPEWVRRATAAHEVAHRVHMNHGPHFHALVADLLGSDPTPARHWLRREGAALHRVGRKP